MSRTLPFLDTAALIEKPDTEITKVQVSIWPVRLANTRTGAQYDHEGEAPIAYADELQVPNRLLTTSDKTYKLIEATPHEFLPHVALRLRETRPGG